jgi:signal transduction histidine kinase
LKGGELTGIVRHRWKKDGTLIDVSLSAARLHDSEGNKMSVIAIAEDVTERKKAEEQLRSSMEQLRELAAHLQSVREEERSKIAREIHDELGQSLTGLKMDLAWSAKRLRPDQRALFRKMNMQLHLVDETIQVIRRISSELRPILLDDLGLVAAIEWQSRQFQERTKVRCHLSLTPKEVTLDRARSTAMYRIFQEALTNVARHARANKVDIRLGKNAGHLILQVKDNGRGIREREIFGIKSLGLLGMRERALMLGGEVHIEGALGKGTTVTAKIPLALSGEDPVQKLEN